MKTNEEVGFKSEIVKLRDGGQILLEYVEIDHPKGIVTIIPGLTSTGDELYVRNTVEEALKNGFSAYVVNHRGSKIPIITPRTYGGSSYEDYEDALTYIRKYRHPEKPLFGIGFSLGAVVLANYLGNSHENSLLKAAICVCSPIDVMNASDYVETNARGFYSYFLSK